MASDVSIRLRLEAGQLKSEASDVQNSIDGITRKLKEAQAAGDDKGVAQMLIALNNATSARQTIMAQARQADNDIKAQNMETQRKMDPLGGMGAWIFQNAAMKITDGVVTAINTAVSAAKMRASGDYTGAAVSYERGMGEMAGGLGGAAVGAGLGAVISAITGLPPQITIPITSQIASSFGQLAGGMSAREKEEALAYSQQYKNALPSLDAMNQNFGGDITGKSLEENNQSGLDMYDRANAAARGTGLSVEDFINAAAKMGSFGVGDETKAMNMARTDAMLARRTGADLGRVQNVSGAFSRYGGEDNASAIAYAGLRSQNMQNGQFNEFLTGMERILEEGIEKGFVRGSEEIAGNMALLYKMSGDSPLWQGEQGAKRLSQMNASISNATNLQSVEDVISYSVAQDIFNNLEKDNPATEVNEREEAFKAKYGKNSVYTGTYVDPMEILERGFSPEMAKGQWEAINKYTNGDTAATIEHLMKMYNLNYTGGKQLWAMMKNADSEGWNVTDLEAKANDILKKDEYKSDSSRLRDALNDFTTNGIKIGSVRFDEVEMPILRDQLNKMDEILREIREDKETPPQNPAITGIVTDQAGNKWPANYWGNHFGVTNDPGGGDYKAQWSRLVQEITDGRSLERSVIPEYYRYQGLYTQANQDGKIDSDELRQLIPALRELARALGKEDAFRGMSDIQFNAWIVE
jgi:hypothetical protein